MLTRLHVRYSADTFPEDLIFQETQDQENFQARYVMHRPWDGSPTACEARPQLFRRTEQAQSAGSGDARGSDRMEPAGRDQESRPAAGVAAEAMVAGHLGLVTGCGKGSARGQPRPRAQVIQPPHISI